MTSIYLLSAKGCSGRAVKIRELSAKEVDDCSVNASKLASPSSTNAEYTILRHREMNHMAVVGVTSTGRLPDIDAAMALPASDWIPLTQLALDTPGPTSYGALFNAKDDGVISAIIQRLHFVSNDDVEAIMGKAIGVSEV